MATLYYYRTKNYYNRSAKRYDTLEEYGNYVFLESATYLNFNIRDGISAVVTAGKADNDYRAQADYVIYCEDNINITSRWFIVEQNFNRKGQYTVNLYRDVLADNWDLIKDCPMFVEKATLAADNPLIFNQESISTNQIKKGETLLKDRTGCPWIVGYFARRDSGGNITTLSGTINNKFTADIVLATPVADWSYYQYTSNWFNEYRSNWTVDVYSQTFSWDTYQHIYKLFTDKTVSKSTNFVARRGYIAEPTVDQVKNIWKNMVTTFNGYVDGIGTPTNSSANTLAFENLQGKIIVDSLGKSYKIIVGGGNNEDTVNETIAIAQGTNAYNYLNSNLTSLFGQYTGSTTPFDLNKTFVRKKLRLEEFTEAENYSYSISGTRDHLIDQPYDMFCMPYGDITVINNATSPSITITSDAQLSLTTATEMMTKYSIGNSAFIYDVQLVPYCPLPQSMITGDGQITITDANQYGTILNGQNAIVGYIFNCSQSSFTLDLPITIAINNTKLENQCDMYRLVSPNFNGQFEFSAAKNGGVNAINVDCTYIPLSTPYIHLNPDFRNLYGADYNDARGLVCGGDFSLPAINSAWNQYQIQNKNFQNIFDREIQNMDVNRKYERVGNIFNAIAGTGQGAVSGAMAGSLGGPIGAGVGAAVGGALSLGGGIADLAIQEALYNEALDYKRDMFGYSLENIKALPQSLARTTAFTYNNKLFPILEYYTCTDEEKKAVANKIAWNGMTVEAIGTMNDFLNNEWSYTINGETITDKGYIKGKIIQLPELEEDYHMAKAIADELNMGVYTKL